MEQLGPIATYIAYAFAFGLVWSHVLNRSTTNWIRMTGYPLVGIIVGEGVWAPYMVAGPEVLSLHAAVAIFSTFAAVVLDIAVERGVFNKQALKLRGIRVNLSVAEEGHASTGFSAKSEA